MARSAVVMVTRGAGDLVDRALRSAKPFVDEMVVLHLGAPPHAADTWRRIGARVVPGEWSSHAADCRNAALAAADADWNLVLEAEEWLASGVDSLRLFTERAEECVGLVEIHRAVGGAHEADHPRHLAPRLLPRGVWFEGARHEEPVFDLPVEPTGVVLRSDDVETARWRADHALREAVVLQALAMRPGDPGLLLDLADELRVSGRFAESSTHCTTALLATPRTDARRHAVVVGALEAYTKAGRITEAVALLHAEAQQWHHSPDLAFLAGDLFFEMLLSTPCPDPTSRGSSRRAGDGAWSWGNGRISRARSMVAAASSPPRTSGSSTSCSGSGTRPTHGRIWPGRCASGCRRCPAPWGEGGTGRRRGSSFFQLLDVPRCFGA